MCCSGPLIECWLEVALSVYTFPFYMWKKMYNNSTKIASMALNSDQRVTTTNIVVNNIGRNCLNIKIKEKMKEKKRREKKHRQAEQHTLLLAIRWTTKTSQFSMVQRFYRALSLFLSPSFFSNFISLVSVCSFQRYNKTTQRKTEILIISIIIIR